MIKRIMIKLMTKEVLLYLVFGVLTTLVNLAVFQLGLRLGLVYWAANIAAWILAVLFAYITNKIFVFESKDSSPATILREFGTFVACRLVSGAFDMGYMIVTIEFFAMNQTIAKITSNVFVVIMNYVFSKLIIFKKKSEVK